jgi:NodT family efflux transporter outer membrane factor (OMF) lipoprotein
MYKTHKMHVRSGQCTKTLTLIAAAVLLSACAIGPDYKKPAISIPQIYKEAQDWVPASPADTLDRGKWWTLFKDPVLDQLEASIEISNQNVAAAIAAYEQAKAVVREQRAAIFPNASLTSSATRSGNNVNTNSGQSIRNVSNNVQLGAGASWEPDVWGNLGRSVNSASASEQASAADLAAATLSAQATLAIDYFSLRQADAQIKLLTDTVASYERSLTITNNRYKEGIAAKSDVLQAQTQLENAKASLLGMVQQRAQYEHAIAVLIGKIPADFALASAVWVDNVPEIPLGVPSLLLQRRPDIASAERKVAAANEQIGIATAAYFPSLKLNASYGYGAGSVANLFSASNNIWSFGLSAAQTLFDAGATKAKINEAEAAHQQAVANYRQTVLNAFQNVEDQLTATSILAQQLEMRKKASYAADLVEQNSINQYRQGLIAYTDVVVAQTTALSARSALVQTISNRQVTAISLIQALGGGWHTTP